MPAAVRCQVNMSARGLAHLRRWPGRTSHDLHTAMSYIADHIVCDTPAGRLEGAEAYRGFQGPFVEPDRPSAQTHTTVSGAPA